MALVRCSERDGRVSDTAASCFHTAVIICTTGIVEFEGGI